MRVKTQDEMARGVSVALYQRHVDYLDQESARTNMSRSDIVRSLIDKAASISNHGIVERSISKERIEEFVDGVERMARALVDDQPLPIKNFAEYLMDKVNKELRKQEVETGPKTPMDA